MQKHYKSFEKVNSHLVDTNVRGYIFYYAAMCLLMGNIILKQYSTDSKREFTFFVKSEAIIFCTCVNTYARLCK